MVYRIANFASGSLPAKFESAHADSLGSKLLHPRRWGGGCSQQAIRKDFWSLHGSRRNRLHAAENVCRRRFRKGEGSKHGSRRQRETHLKAESTCHHDTASPSLPLVVGIPAVQQTQVPLQRLVSELEYFCSRRRLAARRASNFSFPTEHWTRDIQGKFDFSIWKRLGRTSESHSAAGGMDA